MRDIKTGVWRVFGNAWVGMCTHTDTHINGI